MPLNGNSFYRVNQSGNYTMNLYYYTEVLTGETGDVTHNGKQYALDHTDSFKSNRNNWTTTANDHYNITGFTYTNNLRDGSSFQREGGWNSTTYSVTFYNDRNACAINFVVGGSTHPINVQYGANMPDDALNYIPTTVPENQEFVGWYDNNMGVGDPYDFPATMPANNITVYALFEAKTYDSKIHLTITTGGTPYDVELTYGKTLMIL